ncbi:MAG: epoxyqueuosine reductase QueH [Clostridia bacterium]|nr:epoxyqueuosine reductase QueH [Clostridia bacterium]
MACIKALRSEGIEPTGFWYNPNIHPFTEYSARRETLKEYAQNIGLEIIFQDNYGIREFTTAVCGDIDARCGYCYKCRMEAAAKYAAENGFDAFTSTLFISPYQNHELMKEIACAAAEKYGVKFLYRDFRPLFREGQAEARELGLYMQKYCGCIYSEEDRYKKKIEKLTAK